MPVIALLTASANIKDSINVDLAAPIQDDLNYLVSLGHKNIIFAGETLTKSKEAQFLNSVQTLSCTY